MLLRPGARIGVFAPAGRVDRERLERGLEILHGWGYEPVLGRHVLGRHRSFSGTDAERLEDLHWALSAPRLDAAWLARGGYGLTRLLPRLDWGRVRPRPVLGFSDGTGLLLALHRRGLGPAVHAPVVQSLVLADDPSLAALRGLLAGEARGARWSGRVLRPGRAEGPLLGGNLCTLASLAGTPEALRARGAVLLLEEVGEPPYRVDRYLQQLRSSGALEGVRAVVLGDFVDCRSGREGDELEQALLEGLEGIAPLLAGLPVGHGPRNHPFVLGARAVLEGDSLRWELPA